MGRTSHVDPVSPTRITAAIWVLFHRCRHTISQVFLEGGIGNDRDAECKYDRAGLFPPIRIPSIVYSTPLDRHIPYLVSRLPPVPDKPVDRYRQSAIAIAGLPRSKTYLTRRDLKQVPLLQQCSHHRILRMGAYNYQRSSYRMRSETRAHTPTL